jgi:hypothetical protein
VEKKGDLPNFGMEVFYYLRGSSKTVQICVAGKDQLFQRCKQLSHPSVSTRGMNQSYPIYSKLLESVRNMFSQLNDSTQSCGTLAAA